MIQELLGVAVEERKMSTTPGPLVVDTSPTTSVVSSPSSAPPENLCCPRCDSPNTKFCYYNNYNLTQPRHFCKTCRRYWTKGGALRNVPIGGGCRKMRAAASVIPSSTASSRSGGCKPTRSVAGQVPGTGGGHELNLDLLPSLWGSCSMPHSSQLLALLRASQLHQNPNHNYHIVADTSDTLGQVCNNNSFLGRNDSKYQYQHQQQQQNQNHLFGNAPTGSGIQELYQRLRAPANCGSNDNIQWFSNNVGSGPSSSAATATMATTTTTTASILEPLPLFSGGELGYWNPAMSWADLPMPNGAFF
ncbi:uncharacterized protein M6B38_152390 [Iris pallida]|uniref:Dof zinc finger protein n=1 Tax=Iris pallida TaxID=29817 RepID=A0AAX6F6I3_IRIPA|nr:uncharacterized protein M6B38_152390 [Iris pallida]